MPPRERALGRESVHLRERVQGDAQAPPDIAAPRRRQDSTLPVGQPVPGGLVYGILSRAHGIRLSCVCFFGRFHCTRFPDAVGIPFLAARATPMGGGLAPSSHPSFQSSSFPLLLTH